MAKIFQFRNNNNNECQCEECANNTEDQIILYEADNIDDAEMVANYAELIMEAESPEEVLHIMFRFYDNARIIGFRSAIESDIKNKMNFLGEFEPPCTCGQCDLE